MSSICSPSPNLPWLRTGLTDRKKCRGRGIAPRAPTALHISSCRHQITKEIFQVPNFATRAHFLSSWQFMHHSLQNPTCQKEIPKAPELSQARQVGLVWCPAIAIKITPSAPTQLENHFCKTAHLISFKLSFSLSLWPSSILAGYSSVISSYWLFMQRNAI